MADIIDAPIVKRTDSPLAARAETTTEQLIRIALDKGQSPSDLYALLREERQHEAESAYNEAFAAFQRERPKVIARHENQQFKVTREGVQRPSRYADKSDIMDAVGPTLAAHGLSVSWGSPTTSPDGTFLFVPCVVSHCKGHSKPVVYPFPTQADSRNSAPNPQQRWATVLSYAERYALKAALGITEADEDDDDGNQGGSETITEDQARTLNDLLIESGADKARFMEWACPHLPRDDRKLSAIAANKFDTACAMLNKKIAEKRK